jgi:hypothetical protein
LNEVCSENTVRIGSRGCAVILVFAGGRNESVINQRVAFAVNGYKRTGADNLTVGSDGLGLLTLRYAV